MGGGALSAAGLPSELAGTFGLWIALAAAIAIAFVRRDAPPDGRAVLRPACLALAIQLLHFGEEYATGFQRLFPLRLGLAPWSDAFFVAFNCAWLAIWALSILALKRRPIPLAALIALWFLGLAAVANGIGHPLLALANGGYFPGLVTAPFLGVAGFLLLRALARRPGGQASP